MSEVPSHRKDMKEDYGDNCKIPQVKKKIAPLEQKDYERSEKSSWPPVD